MWLMTRATIRAGREMRLFVFELVSYLIMTGQAQIRAGSQQQFLQLGIMRAVAL